MWDEVNRKVKGENMNLIRNVKFALLGTTIALGTMISSIPVFAEALTKVETKRVCMMNNSVFPNDQIPTIVDGKTYYGCCPMCAGKLKSDSALRKAVDPISGKEIDKAQAVIGANSKGKAFYFENEGNFKRYDSKK